MSPRRAIIFNAFAGSEKARALRRVLTRIAVGAELKPTTGPGQAGVIAREAAEGGCDIVIAAGGDGTIHEVADGLVGTRATLGILPIGTMNVFARQLKIPLRPEGAWKVIEDGEARALDLVRVEFSSEGQVETRHFIQMAGLGLDAEVVRRVTWEKKKRWGALSYVFEFLRTRRERPPVIVAKFEDGTSASGAFSLVGNGSYYGGPIAVFHRAVMSDGLMDVCVYESERWRDLFRYLVAVLRGKQDRTRGITYRQCREVEFTSDGETPFELDGELAGVLPVKMTVVPCGLRVLAPRTIAPGL